MQISVVIPVLNEAKSIKKVLESLENQTLHPSEVVIVDGGSSDKTIKEIESFRKKNTLEINVMVHKGANRSVARNIGIEQAQHEVIAVTDAGSFAKKDWLEQLCTPFLDASVDAVAGFYDSETHSAWENAVADFVSVRPWNFDQHSFLPSSRSFAFKKSVWKEVGGYPRELDTCEDLVFAEKVKSHSKGWRVVQEAQVIWQQPKTLAELSEKVFQYALGDLYAGYERHNRKIYSASWRLFMLLVIAFPLIFAQNIYVRSFGISLFVLYLLGSWGKHARLLMQPLNILFIPVLQVAVDAALVQALIFHLLSRRKK